MGQTLENGVYLPSEGERNCYAGLKTNWEILDQKVADVTALQQAVACALHREIVESLPTTDIDPNTIYMVLSGTSATENVYNEFMYVNNAWELIGTSATDLTNYYTKSEVDGKLLLKASASDLTSHTGDATIHVTASDKNRWNNQSYVFRYSSTALVASSTNSNALLDNTDNLKVGDKVIDSSGVLFSITAIDTANSTFTIGTALIDLAQDSDVVHKSGNETITGTKTFENVNIQLKSTSAEHSVSGGYKSVSFYDKNLLELSRTRLGSYSSGLTYIKQTILSYDSNNQQVDATITFSWSSLTKPFLRPDSDNLVSLGISGNKWKDACTYLINGLTPSSLSMPDINNRIDISSYITNLSNIGNEYTPSVNGWICIRSGNATKISVLDVATSVGNASVSNTATYLTVMTPVIANRKVYISVICTSLEHAYFIPCQGNV